MKRSVIIAAGGVGNRMNSAIPKQFLILKDRPIIFHAIDAFIKVYPDIEVVVSLADGLIDQWRDLNYEFDLPTKVILANGGEERFHSIQNALAKCAGDLIAVHDAVRPLVSDETIKACFETAEVTGAAIPVLLIKSSLRRITFDESEAVDRSLYREVQTPQVFKANIIKMGYEQPYQATFTDDASVVEACGHDVILVDGNEENIKITTPFDLKVAEGIFT
ncbi:MAG: 2-C-methyl-D-erythritol 4-phosphate cytidylyltransferase [Crocinitomicaceae bacterium]